VSIKLVSLDLRMPYHDDLLATKGQRPLTYNIIITKAHIAICKKEEDYDNASYRNTQDINIV